MTNPRQPPFPPTNLRAHFSRLVVSLLLLVALACCWLIYQLEQDNRALRFELAEVSHVKYGLLNMDEWEERLSAILQRKVSQYELAGDNREVVKGQVEGLIVEMVDKVTRIMKKKHQQEGGVSGWFKETLFSALVDIERIKQEAPEIAETFVTILEEPENQQQLKAFIAERLHRYAGETIGEVDYTRLNAILVKYGFTEREPVKAAIRARIEDGERSIQRLILGLSVAALLLLSAPLLLHATRRFTLLVALLLGLAVLWIGVACTMIAIEARITLLAFELAGERIEFADQLLFFQSKSILDVVAILIQRGEPKLFLVGGLILLFSVLFPLSKLVLAAKYLYWSNPRFRDHPLVRFFVFRSGKWSMADVMVVAIFMAYLGFGGVMENQLGQLQEHVKEVELLTTSSSRLEIGFYFFLGFCLLSMFLAHLMGSRLQTPEH